MLSSARQLLFAGAIYEGVFMAVATKRTNRAHIIYKSGATQNLSSSSMHFGALRKDYLEYMKQSSPKFSQVRGLDWTLTVSWAEVASLNVWTE
jgi:hypothetical protein